MRKLIGLCMMFLLFGNMAFAKAVSAADIDKITSRGHLVIAIYSNDTPPYIMHDKKGELFGFDIDMSKELADHLGVVPQFVPVGTSYNDLITAVAEGKADVAISRLSRTLDRIKHVNFSMPYLTAPLLLLTHRLDILSAGKKEALLARIAGGEAVLGVTERSAMIEIARDLYPKATLKPYKGADSLAVALKHDEIAAALIEQSDLSNINYNHPEFAIFMDTIALNHVIDTYGIAFNYRSVRLGAWLNLFIEHIQGNGFLEGLKQTYFEDEAWRKAL